MIWPQCDVQGQLEQKNVTLLSDVNSRLRRVQSQICILSSGTMVANITGKVQANAFSRPTALSVDTRNH
jgi:hypothetical protein